MGVGKWNLGLGQKAPPPHFPTITTTPQSPLSFSFSPAKVIQHNVKIKLVEAEEDWNGDRAGVGVGRVIWGLVYFGGWGGVNPALTPS